MDDADLEMLRGAAQSAVSGAVIEVSPQLRQVVIEDRQRKLREAVVADGGAMLILSSISSVGGRELSDLSEELTDRSAENSEEPYLNWLRFARLLQTELVDISGNRVACTIAGQKLGTSSQFPTSSDVAGEPLSEIKLAALDDHQRKLEEAVARDPLTMFLLGSVAKTGGIKLPQFSEAIARDSAWDNQTPYQNWVRVGRLMQAGFIDVSEDRVACTLAGQKLGSRYNELREAAIEKSKTIQEKPQA